MKISDVDHNEASVAQAFAGRDKINRITDKLNTLIELDNI